MKTREQLLWKICEVLQDVKCLHVGEQELNRITDLVVEACEEVVKVSQIWAAEDVMKVLNYRQEEILENLKKLKSK